ncbi:MAG: hypothetical protein R2695_19275 [Acidimicrobiales bacterium]
MSNRSSTPSDNGTAWAMSSLAGAAAAGTADPSMASAASAAPIV